MALQNTIDRPKPRHQSHPLSKTNETRKSRPVVGRRVLASGAREAYATVETSVENFEEEVWGFETLVRDVPKYPKKDDRSPKAKIAKDLASRGETDEAEETGPCARRGMGRSPVGAEPSPSAHVQAPTVESHTPRSEHSASAACAYTLSLFFKRENNSHWTRAFKVGGEGRDRFSLSLSHTHTHTHTRERERESAI